MKLCAGIFLFPCDRLDGSGVKEKLWIVHCKRRGDQGGGIWCGVVGWVWSFIVGFFHVADSITFRDHVHGHHDLIFISGDFGSC